MLGGGSAGRGGDRPPRWQPRPGTAWQWQLAGRIDESVDVPVYDIDGFENSARTVARPHARGRKVICYINVGAKGFDAVEPDLTDGYRNRTGFPLTGRRRSSTSSTP
ncbi:endo alpha-1,4 polygalactosaminidase [Streptomyces botrytidirepellens]|uniref:endo alpha-1,4 polygalactosaminidase n=1 Tax=Streptomyces botrytidirepellens TaxID=2486417 RepID=UPI0026A43AEF